MVGELTGVALASASSVADIDRKIFGRGPFSVQTARRDAGATLRSWFMSAQTADLLVTGSVPAVAVDAEAPSSPYARWLKPSIDVVLATALLLLLLPLLAAVALVVRVTLGPGVLFRQDRVGRDGRVFQIYKFRTMLPDRRGRAEEVPVDRRLRHKTINDPRHTGVGRFLRRWSLDELPQLLNVVRGEMSLVGPRPELVSVVEKHDLWTHTRHLVRPGLTGLWQVTARDEGPSHEFAHLDAHYVQSLSPRTDLRIMLTTLPSMLGTQKGC